MTDVKRWAGLLILAGVLVAAGGVVPLLLRGTVKVPFTVNGTPLSLNCATVWEAWHHTADGPTNTAFGLLRHQDCEQERHNKAVLAFTLFGLGAVIALSGLVLLGPVAGRGR